MTNTFEGVVFVNQATSNTVQVANYVQNLFPNITPQQAQAAAAQYAGTGTNIFQANGIMGEGKIVNLYPTRSLILIRNHSYLYLSYLSLAQCLQWTWLQGIKIVIYFTNGF